jgi:succinate dehydrogenase/fumarate reductase flavoprotein subunit
VAKQTKNGLSRRDFLKGAAVVGAASGIGAMGLPGVAGAVTTHDDWMPASWDYSADVVVIGYGFAGQATAIEAAKASSVSKIIILEKGSYRERGGNSRVCGQGLISPEPAIWDAYKSYLAMATEGQGYPTTSGLGFTSADTIKLYVEGAYQSRQWFSDLGYPLEAGNLQGGKGKWIPFYSNFPGADQIAQYDQFWWVAANSVTAAHPLGGKDWYSLEDAITNKDPYKTKIEIKYKSPACRLVQNPKTREVLGVVITQNGVEKTVKAAKGVVVCGGGWEYNQAMVRNFQHQPSVYSMGSPMNTGDVIKMCADAGAELRNMAAVCAPVSDMAGVMPGYKGALSLGAPTAGAYIKIGRTNQRYKDEYEPTVYGINHKVEAATEGMVNQTGQRLTTGVYENAQVPEPCHMILDATALKSSPLFSGSWATQVEGYKCSPDNSVELANGWIIAADNLQDLATKLDRDLTQLTACIDEWNQCCADGCDHHFENTAIYKLAVADNPAGPAGDPCFNAAQDLQMRRPKARLVPFDKDAKFYAIPVHKGILNTQGGMVRNPKGQVMSIEGPAIPRLYAAGECGDIWTIIYQCMSNVGGGCFAYGRAAGTNVALETAWNPATYGARKNAAKKPAAKRPLSKRPAAQ